MTIFYIDIETDDLRGTNLLQVACISENNKVFNAFFDTFCDLPPRCTKLTGFYTYKGRLFQNGQELETLDKKFAFESFLDWLNKNSDDNIFLIGHNSFSFDFRILQKYFSACDLTFNDKTYFCDSLVILKKFYQKEFSKFSLSFLAEHFKIRNNLPHNGLSDSITLKNICDIVIKVNNLPPTFFITNPRTWLNFEDVRSKKKKAKPFTFRK